MRAGLAPRPWLGLGALPVDRREASVVVGKLRCRNGRYGSVQADYLGRHELAPPQSGNFDSTSTAQRPPILRSIRSCSEPARASRPR